MSFKPEVALDQGLAQVADGDHHCSHHAQQRRLGDGPRVHLAGHGGRQGDRHGRAADEALPRLARTDTGRQRVPAEPTAERQRSHVGADGGHDGPEKKGDAVAVRVLRRGQHQGGEGAEHPDPCEGEDGPRHPVHRRPALCTDEVPHERCDHEEHHHQRDGRNALGVDGHHQHHRRHQAGEGCRPAPALAHPGVALRRSQRDHQRGQHEGGHRAQLEADHRQQHDAEPGGDRHRDVARRARAGAAVGGNAHARDATLGTGGPPRGRRLAGPEPQR